jgi:hypothetical protein
MSRISEPYLNGKNTPAQPGDEVVGGWTREALLKMDARFCIAMERAFARGDERRPEEARERAA